MITWFAHLLAQASPDAAQDVSDRAFVLVLVAIGAGTLISLVGIVWGVSAARAKARDREESRRELAAYVAEGTMSIEDAERLMHAGDWRAIAHAAVSRMGGRSGKASACSAPGARPVS